MTNGTHTYNLVQCEKLSILWLRNITGSKLGLDRPIPRMSVIEAVYHKSLLRNYHMQHAKFKCKHNRLYHFLNQICSQLASISIAWSCKVHNLPKINRHQCMYTRWQKSNPSISQFQWADSTVHGFKATLSIPANVHTQYTCKVSEH